MIRGMSQAFASVDGYGLAGVNAPLIDIRRASTWTRSHR